MRNVIKDENDLLQVSLQGHLHNAFFLCNNAVLLLKREIKEKQLGCCSGETSLKAALHCSL